PISESAPGEEPVVRVAENADRQVVPPAGDQVLDGRIVADVGDGQDGASAGSEQPLEAGEKSFDGHQVLDHFQRQHGVVAAGDLQLLDVPLDDPVEVPRRLARHHRIQLDAGDAAAEG